VQETIPKLTSIFPSSRRRCSPFFFLDLAVPSEIFMNNTRKHLFPTIIPPRPLFFVGLVLPPLICPDALRPNFFSYKGYPPLRNTRLPGRPPLYHPPIPFIAISLSTQRLSMNGCGANPISPCRSCEGNFYPPTPSEIVLFLVR